MKFIMLGFFSLFMKFFSFLFGKFDYLLISVFLLFFLDYFTNLFLDIKENSLTTTKLLQRFLKVLGYLAIIMISVILDGLLNSISTIRDIVLTTLVGNEIIQILKTCARLEIAIPTILISSIQKYIETFNLPANVSSETKKKHDLN